MFSKLKLLAVTLLAVVPVSVDAQQLPVCSISPAPRNCRIGNQVCPSGCIRRNNCPTATVTATSVKTTTVTHTQKASSITIVQTQSASSVTITVTASTSSTTAPQRATETPYANLYAFPDTKCRNATGGLLGIPSRIDGLIGPPIKFNTLRPNPATKYNESSCVTFSGQASNAQSIYFTVDGIPNTNPSCTLNLYTGNACAGDVTRYLPGGANKCDAIDAGHGPWKSAQFKCAYRRDLCTDNQIFLGMCTSY